MFGMWGMWTFAPEAALAQFQVNTNTNTGINALKSDMGGAVLAIGLCLLLYFIRGTKWLYPAMVITFALLIGRIISLGVDEFSTYAVNATIIEVLAICTFYFIATKHSTPPNYIDAIHPDFRPLRFMNNRMRPMWFKKTVNKLVRLGYNAQKMPEHIEMKNYEIEGHEGRKLGIEVYEQKGSTDICPCIVFFHGGGFWMPAQPGYKKLYTPYIEGTNAKLVFVDYTLAMDAPYPAAPEDCYQTALWVYENAAMLGINKNKIALYGDSAGGCLAGVVAQMLRDRNQFKPCFQMLIYPVASDTFDTESAKKFTGVPVWNTPMTMDAQKIYLKGHTGEIPAYAFPLKAKDFGNLPAGYVEIAEYDSLRDEGENYANQLINAGVDIELNEIKGALHAFELIENSEITKEAIRRRIVAFNRGFK